MSSGESRVARIIGKASINPTLFVIGKAAVGLAATLAFLQLLGVRIRQPLVPVLPAVLVAAGLLCLALGVRALGDALRVGLPGEPTTLATNGAYRYSRNPMYTGGYLLLIGCCLYCPHPVVVVSAALGAVIHHRIVLAEEAFLEQRFGAAWLEYRSRTPRYLGLPGASTP